MPKSEAMSRSMAHAALERVNNVRNPERGKKELLDARVRSLVESTKVNGVARFWPVAHFPLLTRALASLSVSSSLLLSSRREKTKKGLLLVSLLFA
jgi:hypothetical protein